MPSLPRHEDCGFHPASRWVEVIMSETSDWMEGIRLQGERDRADRKLLSEVLNARKPDVIVRPKGEGYHYGYFRADNGAGVVRFTRWGGGEWLPETKTEYTFEEIKALASFL